MRFLDEINPVETFTVEASFFPEITKDLIGVEDILRFGVLPLGYKMDYYFFRRRKCLNLGLLDPADRSPLPEIQRSAKEKNGDFESIRTYRIEVEQFLSVLGKVYGLETTTLRALPKEAVSSAIWAHFEELERRKNEAEAEDS